MDPRGGRDPSAAEPLLSVIVLTRNEEANLSDALDSLLQQEHVPLEVVVVDSASGDGTLEVARACERAHPGRVVVVASERDIPIGEARNLGLRHARGRVIAQMSADAMAAPGWAREMVASLEDADIVYGRQVHAPPRVSVAAVVRGLRYHHFDDDARLPPETYASNVNAGVRREVLEHLRYVDEGPASALDDVLFTQEAKRLGRRIAYNPRMVVRHKDASTLRAELRKNLREGYGWGILQPQLGTHRVALAWGAGLGVVATGALAAFAVPTLPALPLALAALAVLYAPALRRVLRGGGRFLARHPLRLGGALLVSPAFDLAFLYHYLLGLLHRRTDITGRIRPPGDPSP